MKVKTWHIGCLVVLIAAALYFLVSSREGLDNPACPVGAPGISSVLQSGGQNIRLYTQSECTAMGGNFAGNGARNWGMANDSVGECIGTSNGINVGFCNQSAPPSSAAKSAVTPTPSPPSDPVEAPLPATPATSASMTPTTPSPVTPPATTTPAGPSYSLTCTAAPVSGMMGSAAPSPSSVPTWNIQQPPSGWNSKNGYTTTVG